MNPPRSFFQADLPADVIYVSVSAGLPGCCGMDGPATGCLHRGQGG